MANWLRVVVSNGQNICVDLSGYRHPNTIFESYRPDIVVPLDNATIVVLELTVCHELLKSKEYKLNKYRDLSKDIRSDATSTKVQVFMIEVSTLGFISDISEFVKYMRVTKMTSDLKQQFIKLHLTIPIGSTAIVILKQTSFQFIA